MKLAEQFDDSIALQALRSVEQRTSLHFYRLQYFSMIALCIAKWKLQCSVFVISFCLDFHRHNCNWVRKISLLTLLIFCLAILFSSFAVLLFCCLQNSNSTYRLLNISLTFNQYYMQTRICTFCSRNQALNRGSQLKEENSLLVLKNMLIIYYLQLIN